MRMEGLIQVLARGVWIFTLSNLRQNLIFLKKRHEHAGFFRRHESHIVRAGFGLAGGILGYAIRGWWGS